MKQLSFLISIFFHVTNAQPNIVRLILLSFVYQLIALNTYAQLDAADKSFIYTILKQEPHSDSIRYTNRLNPIHRFSPTQKNFKNSSITGYDPREKKEVVIKLTRAERMHLRNELRDAYNLSWPDSLFPGSRMIPVDSMWSFVSQQIRMTFRENPSESDDRRHWMAYSTVFQFSKPIFLKNRSIAVFYFLRLCSADCGVEDFSVYRLENGEYKRWLIIAGGAF